MGTAHHPELQAPSASAIPAQGVRGGRTKIVLILDQFEQWLHGHREDADAELIRALRQCDGSRLQAVVMVRDDFAMAAARFMRALEIPIVEGENFATVDLFDLDHAERVLARFGQAYGRLSPPLPSAPSVQSRDGVTNASQDPTGAFLSRAVRGLAQDAKVVSVRLALFAEMVKDKAWTPETLDEVGGTEGVGVNFLEETFRSRSANPKYRLHEQGACAVLRALLPEVGTDIKGHMRSHTELLDASGYGDRPRDFDDLLRILDGELRLITPTDPEGARSDSGSDPTAKFYQLTHDYVVPSLRTWLTQRQRESRKGRAELRLAERAALWKAKPENRHLPSLLEYLSIRRWTTKKRWSELEGSMMCKAGRVHASRAGIAILLAAAMVAGGLLVSQRIEAKRRLDHAQALVDRLASADIAQVPEVVQVIDSRRAEADPLLRLAYASAKEGAPEQLHLALALLPSDESLVDEMAERLLHVTPAQFPIVRDALLPHAPKITESLWSIAQGGNREQGIGNSRTEDQDAPAPSPPHPISPSPPRTIPERFQAACALATYAPNDERWKDVASLVASHLVSLQASEYLAWRAALRPARAPLVEPLSAIYRDSAQKEQPLIYATETLAEYAADRPEVLFSLLVDAELFQFPQIYSALSRHPEEARTLALVAAGVRGQGTGGRKPEDSNHEDAKDAKKNPLEQFFKGLGKKQPTDDELDVAAQRQAKSAVALFLLGDRDAVWPLLAMSPDPSVRSYLIHWLAPLGADPSAIIERLQVEQDVSIKRALVLSLGQFTPEQLGESERTVLAESLLKTYETDPDPGLHGATEWLLRQWGHKDGIESIVKKLRIRERDRRARKIESPWYVNAQGQTFVVLGPSEFLMGSPETEKDRPTDETQHSRKIPYKFAIATHEVTNADFKRFEESIERVFVSTHEVTKRVMKTSDSPQISVDWYDAAWYCNWLSEREGIPEDQWCYEPNGDGDYAEGMKIKEKCLELSGYRLPTEAEWEYACRSGATTSRYHGRGEGLLGEYAWFLKNSQDRSWPVGEKKPNEFGLVDMHGNAIEWCQEAYGDYSEKDEARTMGNGVVNNSTVRVLRGGSFSYQPAVVRSAYRNVYLADSRYIIVGFRVSRTYY